jgi:hypothetical protein
MSHGEVQEKVVKFYYKLCALSLMSHSEEKFMYAKQAHKVCCMCFCETLLEFKRRKEILSLFVDGNRLACRTSNFIFAEIFIKNLAQHVVNIKQRYHMCMLSNIDKYLPLRIHKPT